MEVIFSSLMSISEKLSQLNHQRYQDWSQPFDTENAKQAIFVFKGDVYTGFDLPSWKARDFEFAQKSIRILSGLYGMLRPLDLMQPYRLEMGTALKNERGANLYDFWGSQLTEDLNLALANFLYKRGVIYCSAVTFTRAKALEYRHQYYSDNKPQN